MIPLWVRCVSSPRNRAGATRRPCLRPVDGVAQGGEVALAGERSWRSTAIGETSHARATVGDQQCFVGHAAALQFAADAQQVQLAVGLVVHQPGQTLVVAHALDLDPPAAGHGHVHVLPGRAPTAPRTRAHTGDVRHQPRARLQFQGRVELGLGHHLGQRHSQTVGPEDDAMSDVADLAAAVLLERELPDAQGAIDAQFRDAEGDLAVQSDHRRALEARGDRSVQVLLAHDVQFVDRIEIEQVGDLERDPHRLVVDLEGRRVVHLVGAHAATVEQVDDLLARLELHERGAVVLAELAQRGTHVAQHFGVGVVGVVTRRAPAEEFGRRVELLVDLEPTHESELVVVGFVELAPLVVGEVEQWIRVRIQVARGREMRAEVTDVFHAHDQDWRVGLRRRRPGSPPCSGTADRWATPVLSGKRAAGSTVRGMAR